MAYRKRRKFPSIGGKQGFSSQAVTATRAYKLRYVHTGTLATETTTGFGQYSFRANSIYDPDYTGVGHQPMGHDTLELLYGRYTVVGSAITVRLTNRNSTAQSYGIYLSDDTKALDKISTYMECKRGPMVQMRTSNTKPYTCRNKYSARKF